MAERNKWLMGALLAGLALGLAAQDVGLSAPAVADPVAPPASAAPARVMVVNLSPETVDLQLGDPAVFSVAALAPQSPTALGTVAGGMAYSLYFRAASDGLWRYFQGLDGQPAALRFAPGSLSLIRIGLSGSIDILRLEDQPDQAAADSPVTARAKVFFLNGTAGQLDAMSLHDANLASVVELGAIPAQALSYLVSLPDGQYAARWDSGASSGLTTGLDANGQPVAALTRFEAGRHYAVLAAPGAGSGGNQIRIWDLDLSPAP